MISAETGLTALDLLAGPGRELLDELSGLEVSPDRAMTLSASLRGRYPAELIAAALTQQALRMSARAKFSQASQMLFTRAGLEQASSELTARHAAARYADATRIADLCCGIGANLAELAAGAGPGRRLAGFDLDPVAVAFARHNAQIAAPAADSPSATLDSFFIPPCARSAAT